MQRHQAGSLREFLQALLAQEVLLESRARLRVLCGKAPGCGVLAKQLRDAREQPAGAGEVCGAEERLRGRRIDMQPVAEMGVVHDISAFAVGQLQLQVTVEGVEILLQQAFFAIFDIEPPGNDDSGVAPAGGRERGIGGCSGGGELVGTVGALSEVEVGDPLRVEGWRPDIVSCRSSVIRRMSFFGIGY